MSILTISANVNGTISNTAYNDMYLDALGNISMSRDLNAILEECAQAAKTQLGELIFNINVGIPYFDVLWTGVPNAQQFNAAVTNALLSINGVLEVVSLVSSQEVANAQSADNYKFTAIIRTIYGTGTING